MNTAIEPNGQVEPRREALWFTLAALAFVILEIAALGAWAMVTRPFWLDEVSTYLVAGTQSVADSMRNLARGGDYNPPAAFLLYRVVGLLAGGLTPVSARLFTAACVLGALTIIYTLLREQFPRWPAAIGVLAVWALQVVMHAAFEARFYGPLLLASSCLFLVLLRAVRREPTSASAVTLALVSIAVCTIHYFGILTWAIGTATVVLSVPGARAGTIRRLLPSIAGPLALAACAPLYFGQRASITIPTWMPDLTAAGALRLLGVFFLTLPIAIALCCWALTRAQAWRTGSRTEGVPGRAFALGPLLLLTQVAVPFVLVAFSMLVQPATETRYWIAGAFATAPVVALVVSRAAVPIRWITTFGMVAASVKTMVGETHRAQAFALRVRDDIRVATQLTASGELVVTRLRDTLYPVLQARPDLNSHTAALDSTPLDSASAFFTIERDLGRNNNRLYGFGNLVTPADLGRLPSFYFMEPSNQGAPTVREFPQFTIVRVGDRAFHLVRQPSQ